MHLLGVAAAVTKVIDICQHHLSMTMTSQQSDPDSSAAAAAAAAAAAVCCCCPQGTGRSLVGRQ
jgi:hypothetical protein